MSINPQQARNDAANQLVAEYERLELILLELISDRLRKGAAAPDWAQRQLTEITTFRTAARTLVGKMAGTSAKLLDAAMRQSIKDGKAAATADVAKAEKGTTGNILRNDGTRPATDSRAIALIIDEAHAATNALNSGILRSSDDIYRKVIARGAVATVSGVQNRIKATQRALDEFAAHGIASFRDSNGKTWSMTAYAEMAVRTASTRALITSHNETLTERGYDLVVVSSHPRPAPVCQPYERQILSLSGRNVGAVELPSRLTGEPSTVRVKASLAEAMSRGFQHPSCRHRTQLFVPDVTDTTPTEPDDEGYENTQELRRLERGVRDWKRKAAAAMDPDAKKAANAKAREWQGKIKTHTEQTGVGRRRDREQITGVYGPGNPARAAIKPTPKPTPAKPKPKLKPTLLSAPTRELIEQARTTLPTDKAGWLDTTLKYPKDKNGAKLVPEKLQRHLDTTLTVGKAIRADAVKRFDTDPAMKKLRKEDKDLLASGGAFSPRRDAIFRDIARRESALIREALAEVRPIGGVQQAAKIADVPLPDATKGIAEDIAAVRRAEKIFPDKWLQMATAKSTLEVGRSDRAFYNGTWDFIAAPEKDHKPNYRGAFDSYSDEVMAHELGHRMETLIPGLTQLEFALIRSRSTKNGILEPQTKVYPNRPELADEVGYEDDWHNKYAGKTYANDQMADPARRAAEAFQVGIQDTFGRSNPTGEFDKTSQLQEFVIGVMALL
ncbi:phage minor capsid protein [Rhodococcus sp. ARC_M12]|uniref:phage minor capsid protein n=1 Tax=Rhodococcus sp. ARC_M12 TaxID=2928854 RepID=UPI001FB354C2|nr:phage minor capsid protein [Rhodococcus sp. ARC_M12]MCJ0980425.1 phage minor capsid protein [Rhodococcus sp. ARC_M12]